jgi:pimeloyl-ACP methyl ester carboxylesterase
VGLPRVLAEVLGMNRPVFIGSSVGGMLALDLARYHPDDFRAVIALEGGLRVELPEEMHDMERSSFTDTDPAKHAASMMTIMSPTAPEVFRQETRLHYAQGAPGVFPGDIHYYSIEHDLRGQADRIDTSRCAVHLLTGEYDFPTVPWTRTAAEQIQGATYEIMESLGHFPMSEDHDALMRYVLPLLDAIAT